MRGTSGRSNGRRGQPYHGGHGEPRKDGREEATVTGESATTHGGWEWGLKVCVGERWRNEIRVVRKLLQGKAYRTVGTLAVAPVLDETPRQGTAWICGVCV